ncbi:MAG: ThiF family adenylyltransferase [Proteobacteria bacterium]|nr:ThiF family adenylyltransferase [Pseudomonadota bacterium]
MTDAEDTDEFVLVAYDEDGNEIPDDTDPFSGLKEDEEGSLDLTFGEHQYRRMEYDSNDRFAIYKLMAHFREDIVREGMIFCAGAGALGNEVLKNFALLGVGNLWFCDFDDIDASNLAKSVLFRPRDIGRAKVEVAAERLKDMDPDMTLVPLSADIRFGIGMGVFRRMDVLCSVVDSIDARVGFNRIAAALGKPWLDAGIGELSWRVTCWDPPGGPCFECTMDNAMRYQQHLPYAPSCAPMAEAIREMQRQPTSPLAAAMSGAMMAQEALKLLHDVKMETPPEQLEMPHGVQYYFGGGDPYLEAQVRRPTPDCEGHDFWGEVTEVREFTAERTTVRELLQKGADLLEVDLNKVSLRIGYDLVVEKYCHQCGTRTEYIKPQRARDLDLSCPNCDNEARPDYKRALRVFDKKFIDRPLADLGFPKLQIFLLYGGKGRIAVELTGDEAEVMGGG